MVSKANSVVGIWRYRFLDAVFAAAGHEVLERAQMPYIAVTQEHLVTGIQYLLARHRLTAERSRLSAVEMKNIEAQLARIDTAVGRFTEISRGVSKAEDALDGIRSGAESIRSEIRDALVKIEEASGTPQITNRTSQKN